MDASSASSSVARTGLGDFVGLRKKLAQSTPDAPPTADSMVGSGSGAPAGVWSVDSEIGPATRVREGGEAPVGVWSVDSETGPAARVRVGGTADPRGRAGRGA
eukprot:151676-Chlamydomonas_euryale.AAC.2